MKVQAALESPMQDKISAKVQETFAPSHLEIENESYKHSSGPKNSQRAESHFRLLMVSDQFAGQSRINRQRSVFELLKEEMKSVHALSLRLLTQAEWDGESFTTPNCQSKK